MQASVALPHVSPQHGWPFMPHVAQTAWLHPRPEPQVSPAQHAWPAAPHCPQTLLLLQLRFDPQALPAQHGSPAPPHVAHVPLLQPRLEPVHTSLAQQG